MNSIQTTLGISLGTRTIGFAVLQEQKLYDWGIKSFKEKWSNQKLRKIIKALECIIEENEVNHISIKVPKEYETYHSLQILHRALCKNFVDQAISVYTSSLNSIKLWYSIENRSPKSSLEKYIAIHYPVLSSRSDLSNDGKKYYMKIYEALAAAEMSLFLK